MLWNHKCIYGSARLWVYQTYLPPTFFPMYIRIYAVYIEVKTYWLHYSTIGSYVRICITLNKRYFMCCLYCIYSIWTQSLDSVAVLMKFYLKHIISTTFVSGSHFLLLRILIKDVCHSSELLNHYCFLFGTLYGR